MNSEHNEKDQLEPTKRTSHRGEPAPLGSEFIKTFSVPLLLFVVVWVTFFGAILIIGPRT